MIKYFFITGIAFLSSLLLTPLVKYFSYKFNVLDQPGSRKIHAKPIPLLGGVAIFLSFAIATYFMRVSTRELLVILGVGFIFIMFGLLDDAGIKIRASYKILGHLVLASLFVFFSGICFNLFNFGPINCILTICFITFMTNSMNMLDGMDGLVAGISLLAALCFFVLALNNDLPLVAMLSLAVAGATLGFLRYNFNPASIFLGEAGSTFLGYILAVIALNLKIFKLWGVALLLNIPRLQFVSFIVPLIVLGIPIFDTMFVFANRFLHRIKMSTPGKDHSHHRINMMGLSQKMTVLALYCVQIILGAIALSTVNSDLQQFFSLLLIVAVLAAFAVMFLLKVKVYSVNALSDDFFNTP